MSLRGQHEHNLDSKDRITVPAAHRAALADGVVVMAGVEPCIEVWPRQEAEAMEAKWLGPLSPLGADGRRIRRRVFGTSEQTDLDSAGRVRIPTHLKSHGSLDGRCTIVGVGSHLEIWNQASWEDESVTLEEQVGELTERIAAQGEGGGVAN